MQPASLETLKRYAESGEYYSDCAQLALERIAELESKLDGMRSLVERDGYQAKNGGNGGRQFLEALQEALK